jgi:hypothetical protein
MLVEKAVRRPNDQKVSLVLHAGDYTSPSVITKFKINFRFIGVFGKRDGDHELLKKALLKRRTAKPIADSPK